MPEPESTSPAQSPEHLTDQLRNERARRLALEEDVVALQQKLTSEQAKLRRLRSRRSVKFALAISQTAGPMFRVFRRRESVSGDSELTAQRKTVSKVRSLRRESGPTSGPLVSAVVLNRDGAHHLQRLLVGLRDNTAYRSFELVVVDNASTDGSVDLLSRDWGFPVKVIRNNENVTFSRGCNQGLDAANGIYTLLLNNDVAPINAAWLGALVSCLEDDSSSGAAGALLVYPARPGYVSGDPNTGADLTIQHRGIRFQWRRKARPAETVPWAYNMGVGEDPTKAGLACTTLVPAATAACLLVRTGLLRELGGLDEGFIYGMEDVDICLRIRQQGHNISLVGEAALFHHEFGTQSRLESERRRGYGLSNLHHFSRQWAAILSRRLDLEAVAAMPTVLRDPDRARIIHVAGHDAMQGLEDALTSAGFTVMIGGETAATADVVISVDPEFDVSGAPSDALRVAWITKEVAVWTGRPWFDRHEVAIPGSAEVARQLLEAGTAPGRIVTPAQPTELLDAVAGYLMLPRLGLNTDEAHSPLAGLLAAAFTGIGIRARIRTQSDWETPAAQSVDIVLHIAGCGEYTPRQNQKSILLIADGTAPTSNLDQYDLVLGMADESVLAEVDGAEVHMLSTSDRPALTEELRAAVDALDWRPNLRFAPE